MREETQQRSSRFAPVISTADWGGRPTRAEVNLDLIAGNVATLRATIGAAHFMAVIKGNGYGHGAVAIARTAIASGADFLGVYTPDEGLQLRASGIESPVLVFGPFTFTEAKAMAAAGLIATVTSIETAERLQASCGVQTVDYFLKVDTGLHRAGIEAERAIDAMRRVVTMRSLRPAGIFTHFAAADEPDKTPTLRQLAVFLDTIAELEKIGVAFPIRSAANTGALLDLPETHLDMVRAGIGLYGYHPSIDVRRRDIRPALQLLSVVTRVHEIPAGAGVGYGYEYRAPSSTRIALVPIGYGDGLPRSLGHGRGRVLIRGKKHPIVGRVSMDQITVATADPDVAVGNEVALIGAQQGASQDADDLGMAAGTISYDILTGLLSRIPRVYVAGERITGTTTLCP